VRIHQALYGEEQGAHTLLRHSILNASEEVPFKQLLGVTDRFGSPPPGVQWTPYMSGYPYRNFYVLSRTFPDVGASRPGMVLTHALLVPLEELSKHSVLSHITQLLLTGIERPPELPVLDLGPLREGPRDDVSAGRQLALIRALVRSAQHKQPAIWAGQEGIEKAIEALWLHLWPQARQKIRFRLSFGPSDVEGQELTAVSTPKSLLNRWPAPYIVVGDDQGETSRVTLAEAYLLGRKEAVPLHELQDILAASLDGIPELLLLVQCCESLPSVENCEDADAVRRVARLLAQLSPSAERGDRIKTPVLTKLARLTANGSVSDIRALRNFDLSPFVNGADVLEDVIHFWVRNTVTSPTDENTSDTASILKLALTTPTGWGEMVRRGLQRALEPWSQATASRIWEWWGTDADLVTLSEGLLPATGTAEQTLALGCPAHMSSQLALPVINLAKGRLWYSLHAAVLTVTHTPEEAVREQLAFDPEKQEVAALRVLADRVGEEPFLLTAIKLSDPRPLPLAGEILAQRPQLRMHMEMSNSSWRKVWLLSIEAGAQVFEGVPDPKTTVSDLMDVLRNGGDVAEDLLSAVAATEYADLSDYPGRANIWGYLPSSVLGKFLQATAWGWIQRFSREPGTALAIESPLAKTVVEEAPRWLTSSEAAPALVLDLFRRFPALEERHFIPWLTADRPLRPMDAPLVGRYIGERGWVTAARSAWKRVTQGQRSLLPVVKECAHLLPTFERLMQRFTSGGGISDDEWWVALTDVSVELYPRGLEDRSIWQRSAGDLSVVELKAPGRSQWEVALALLRKGGGGKKITVADLLHRMREDYHGSEHLQFLERNLR